MVDDDDRGGRLHRGMPAGGGSGTAPSPAVPRGGGRSLVRLAVVVLLVVVGSVAVLVGCGAAGDETGTEVAAVATSAPSTTPGTTGDPADDPSGALCGQASGVDAAALAKVAGLVETSRVEASADGMIFPTLAVAQRVGTFRGPMAITEVEPIETAPLNMIPGEDGEPPSNTLGGLSVHWAGVQVTVGTGGSAAVVRIPLTLGGPDVVAADLATLDLAAFDALVGSCAVLFDDQRDGAGAMSGSAASIVAVSTAADGPPLVMNRQFRGARDLPSTLEGILAIPRA